MGTPPHNPSFPFPGKVYGEGRGYHLMVKGMKEQELKELVSQISSADLKSEVKKRGIKMGRCPTKMDFAKKLPDDVLKKLAGK
jgi:hypothetical protein